MIGKFFEPSVPSVSRWSYRITSFGGVDAESPKAQVSPEKCSYGYNIRLRGGVLTRTYGINDAVFTSGENEVRLPLLSSVGQRAVKMHHYRRRDRTNGENKDELIVFGSAHGYLKTKLTETSDFEYMLGVLNLTSETDFINYYMEDKDCCLIFTGSGGMYVYDGEEIVSYPEAPAITSACMHYDRVFGVSAESPDTIYFSAPLTPYEFSPERGGGSISLMDEGGKILKLISFRNSVFVFREYAVYKLTAYTDPTEYSLSRIFVTRKKIRASTIAADHLNIVFVAGSEAYVFDGFNSMNRFFKSATPLIEDAENAVGCIFDGKYYLAANMRREGELIGDEGTLGVEKNNALFVMDLYSDDIDLVRGVDIVGFAPVVNSNVVKLLVNFGNARGVRIGILDESGKLFGRTLPRLWRSAACDFGWLGKSKILRRMYVKSRYDADIAVIADEEKRKNHTFRGSFKASGASYDMRGDTFRLELDSRGEDLLVSGIETTYDINRRYNAN